MSTFVTVVLAGVFQGPPTLSGICAKTGTAQIMIGRKVVGHTIWFASFAPYGDPRYVVVVMLETELPGGSGAETCAPVAQQVYLALQKREQQMKLKKPETLASR